MSTIFTAARAPRPVAQSFTLSKTQVRHATLIKRPKRPYQFTQVVTLSDGSTFMHRTTSPEPLYKSTKDIKNSLLWNPSSQKLANAEDDLAGRLRSFRNRFGRGWDSEAAKKTTHVGLRQDSRSIDVALPMDLGYSGQFADMMLTWCLIRHRTRPGLLHRRTSTKV